MLQIFTSTPPARLRRRRRFASLDFFRIQKLVAKLVDESAVDRLQAYENAGHDVRGIGPGCFLGRNLRLLYLVEDQRSCGRPLDDLLAQEVLFRSVPKTVEERRVIV